MLYIAPQLYIVIKILPDYRQFKRVWLKTEDSDEFSVVYKYDRYLRIELAPGDIIYGNILEYTNNKWLKPDKLNGAEVEQHKSYRFLSNFFKTGTIDLRDVKQFRNRKEARKFGGIEYENEYADYKQNLRRKKNN